MRFSKKIAHLFSKINPQKAVAVTALFVVLVLLIFFTGSVHGERKILFQTKPVVVSAHTKPADMKHVKVNTKNSTAVIEIPEDGWVTAMGFSGVQGAAENAARFLWAYDQSEQDPYCPQHKRVIFVMSVEKLPEMAFPPQYGYPVHRGNKILLLAGFGNFTDKDYPAASVHGYVTFVPAKRDAPKKEIYPLFLNAECDSLFAVPAKTKNFVKKLSRPFPIPFDGRIILMGTHSHNFATDMVITRNDHELWRTTPIRLPDGKNLGNPTYLAPYDGVPVKKGDLLDFMVTYSNPLDRPIDAMASSYIRIVRE